MKRFNSIIAAATIFGLTHYHSATGQEGPENVRLMSFDEVHAMEDTITTFRDPDGVVWTLTDEAEIYDEGDEIEEISEDDFYTGEEDFEDDNTWTVLFDDGRQFISDPIDYPEDQDADEGEAAPLGFPFQQVFPPLNTAAPFKWVAHLSGTVTCSSAVVGRRVLITAAHCLHSGTRRGRWYRNFRVRIARTGNCSQTSNCPMGQAVVQYALIPSSWRKGLRRRWPVDRGIVVLRDSDRLPTHHGSFDYKSVSGRTIRKGTVVTAGYPGNPGRGTMWFDICRTDRVMPRKFFHDCTSRGGQSGSGIWLRGTHTLVGVISGWGAVGNNRATRMNGKFVGMINKQVRNHP